MRISTPILLFLFLLPGYTMAQEVRIEVDPDDKLLVIKGWVGEENSFTGNFRVTLRGALQDTNPVKLAILPSDLKRTQATETIGRQQIIITGDQALTPDLPTVYQVKVLGLKEYGEYNGKIELLLAGQLRERAEMVDVTVVAEVRPALTLLSESDRIKVNLVNCDASCFIARLLLPASSFQNVVELHFEKPVAAPLAITDKTFIIKGDQTQFQLTDQNLQLSLPAESHAPPPGVQSSAGLFLRDKKYITMPVTLSYQALPPDHYTGTIYLSVRGQNTAVKVPVDLSLRTDPFWPLLLLIASIFLGRLFKYMQEKGNPKADALGSIYRIEFRLQTVNPDDRTIIAPMVDRARQLINEDQVEQAIPLIKTIEARLATLNELREIRANLTGKEEHPHVKAILDHINQARECIRQGQDAAVKTHVDAIMQALVELLSTSTMMGPGNQSDPSIVDASERAKFATASTARATQIAPPPAPLTGRQRLNNWLAWLSGVSDELRAEATLWLLRPLLWVLLIVLLLALGMKSLYIDNPVFGANPWSDYLSLIFWGLSSDVASRTLSNLKITKAGNQTEA